MLLQDVTAKAFDAVLALFAGEVAASARFILLDILIINLLRLSWRQFQIIILILVRYLTVWQNKALADYQIKMRKVNQCVLRQIVVDQVIILFFGRAIELLSRFFEVQEQILLPCLQKPCLKPIEHTLF